MQCQQANELFSDYIERNLDAAQTVSVDNHLATCVACREEMASLRQLWTRLDAMPVVDPPAMLHSNLIAAIDAQLAPEGATQSSRQRSASRADSEFGSQGILASIRALFRPQALAFATGLAIVVLSGLEVAHSRSASVPSPISFVIGLFNKNQETSTPPESANKTNVTKVPNNLPGSGQQNPSISVNSSVWKSNADGTGTLTLELNVAKDSTGTQNLIEGCTLELVQGDATRQYPETAVKAKTEITFSANGNTTVTLPVQENLTGQNISLVFALPAVPNPKENGSGVQGKEKIVVPLQLLQSP